MKTISITVATTIAALGQAHAHIGHHDQLSLSALAVHLTSDAFHIGLLGLGMVGVVSLLKYRFSRSRHKVRSQDHHKR